jgi:hypothetical protein
MAERHRFMYLSRADVEAVGRPPSAIMAAVGVAFREMGHRAHDHAAEALARST